MTISKIFQQFPVVLIAFVTFGAMFFVLLKQPVYSADIDKTVALKYRVLQNNQVEVSLDISFVNNGIETQSLREYNLNVGTVFPQNIDVYSLSGGTLSYMYKNNGSNRSINVAFGDLLLSGGEQYQIRVTFVADGLARKSGELTIVELPSFAGTDLAISYAELEISSTSGQVLYSSFEDISQSVNNETGYSNIRFAPASWSVPIFVFGNEQSYRFTFQEQIDNDTSAPSSIWLPLIHSTCSQQVMLEYIYPSPNKIVVDSYGNHIAEYVVSGKSSVDIRYAGTVTRIPYNECVSREFSVEMELKNEEIAEFISVNIVTSEITEYEKAQKVYDYLYKRMNLVSNKETSQTLMEMFESLKEGNLVTVTHEEMVSLINLFYANADIVSYVEWGMWAPFFDEKNPRQYSIVVFQDEGNIPHVVNMPFEKNNGNKGFDMDTIDFLSIYAGNSIDSVTIQPYEELIMQHDVPLEKILDFSLELNIPDEILAGKQHEGSLIVKNTGNLIIEKANITTESGVISVEFSDPNGELFDEVEDGIEILNPIYPGAVLEIPIYVSSPITNMLAPKDSLYVNMAVEGVDGTKTNTTVKEISVKIEIWVRIFAIISSFIIVAFVLSVFYFVFHKFLAKSDMMSRIRYLLEKIGLLSLIALIKRIFYGRKEKKEGPD